MVGLQFREHVVAHLVTAGAECLGVGQFQRGIEAAPEDHAGDEAGEHQHAEPEHRTRPAQHVPQFDDEIPEPRQPRSARRCRVGRAHRRPPGVARLSRVSMSTKSLVTGGFTTFCGTWHEVQKNRRGDTEARNWPSRSMKWVIETIGACDFPGAGAGMAGQAFVAVHVDLIAVDRMRNHRRLLGIVARFLFRCVAHRRHRRRRTLLVERASSRAGRNSAVCASSELDPAASAMTQQEDEWFSGHVVLTFSMRTAHFL